MIRKAVLTILVLVAAGLAFAYMQFDRAVGKEIKAIYAENVRSNKVVTEEMLQGLPAPVQRYLRYSGVIGKEWVNTVSLEQTGQMKPSPQGKWFPFVAEEYYSINPPRFVWRVRGPKKWAPVIQGKDGYKDERGQMLIKLFSLFPVASAEGEEMDQGAMMRYLNEMMWFPTAFLGNNISWKGIDNDSAQVTLTARGKSVSALMRFDSEGKLANFIAQRYLFINNSFSLETWETPISGYGRINELNLPTKGSAVWKLDNGEYKYIDISVNKIKYN